MLWFSKDHVYPIGTDISDEGVKLAQLIRNGKDVSLIASGFKERPLDMEVGSSRWQRWVIEAISELAEEGCFRGREIIASVPAGEVFIDHIKVTECDDEQLHDTILSKVRHKFGEGSDDLMLKYIRAEDDNVLVIAVEREKIDRHLAIYEKTNLSIKSIGIWPTAIANTYAFFFGKRACDEESIVMLIDLESSWTNVAICRHKNLLFARSIPIGSKHICTEEMVTRLTLELGSCMRYFGSMYRMAIVERIIFLSSFNQMSEERVICGKIAHQLEIPAQIGDCMTAVGISDNCISLTDRRGKENNWTVAFGLGLLEEEVFGNKWQFGIKSKVVV